MGIHCKCPNGHHLNLKKELAGKVGYCPFCRVKFYIPKLDDMSPESKGSVDRNASSTRTSSQGSQTRNGKSSKPSDEGGVLLDDPNVLWHVRTSDNQEYGPAVGSVIRQWIVERRISPQMLVWRNGWEQWEEAGKVFPEVLAVFNDGKEEESQNDAGSKGVLRQSVARLIDADVAGRSSMALRKKKAVNTYRLILGLIGLIVVLLIALIMILFIH